MGDSDWATDRADASKDGDAFIQWKGTTVCMDLKCTDCGELNHICNTGFAYYVECGCGAVFEMKAHVAFRRVDSETYKGMGVFDVDFGVG